MQSRNHINAVKRSWYSENKDRINAERRAETGEKRERTRARNRAQYANMTPEQRANWSAYMYSYGLKRRFKIPLVRWLALFHLQGERCACCRSRDPRGVRWHTDHNHETGEIRGILCCKCNQLLGQLGDNERAVEMWTLRFTSYLRTS
jgi:hypothetical protein